MRICFLYHNRSTTMGGIQLLIHSLQYLFNSKGHSCSEVNFFDNCLSDNVFEAHDFVNYQVNSEALSTRGGLLWFLMNSLLSRIKTNEAILRSDVIFVFNPNMLVSIPFELIKKKKVVLVQTNRFDKFFSKFSLLYFKYVLSYINDVTVYTSLDKEKFMSFFPNFKNVSIIPRACKLDTSAKCAQYGKNLLFVGRISERSKNFKDMILIMRELGSEYTLSIYGDGPADEVKKLNDKIAGLDNVRFLGPSSDVALVCSMNSIFIMTSHYEGFGNTLIEARSQGLPIVAFDTFDALRWIVKDDINGCVVEYRDIHAFASAVRNISSNEETYTRFSKNAIAMACSTEKNVVNKKWLSLIEG